MKAHPDEQKKLLALQNFDTKLTQLGHAEATIAQLSAIDAIDGELVEIHRRLVERAGERDDARTELRRIESDVEVVEARIGRDTARLEGTLSAKDTQAFESELESLRTRRSDLEDIELAVMEKVEGCDGAVAEVESEREDAEVRRATLAAERDREQKAIDEKRAETIRERSALVETLDAELVALYDKQRGRYGIGAALLRGGVSGGSGMALNEADLRDIRQAAADEVLLCPDGGAILVRTEESGL